MLRSEYTRDSNSGFRLEKARPDEIIGRYIEYRQVIEEVRDPLGQVITFTRDVYDIVRFRLTTGFPELELEDPPRRYTPFLTRLGEFTDFSVAVSPVEANLRQWVEAIEREFTFTTIIGVTSGPCQLGGQAILRFALSGSEDIRQQLDQFADTMTYIWEKARLRTVIEGHTFEYDLSRLGSVSSGRELTEELLGALRNTLTLVVRGA